MNVLRPALAASTLLAVLPAAASADQMTGVDTRNNLVTFNSLTPNKVATRGITGLPAGVSVQGLDRRPANDTLVALGSNSQLFAVDAASGAATPIGSGPFMPTLFGSGFGFDFNPTVDRIRLTSNFGQNLRLQPDMGTVAATDSSLSYAPEDRNAGKRVAIAASAYTNSVKGSMMTQLFNIDTVSDSLVLQDPPNAGTLKTVGELGLGNVANPVAFDISGTTGRTFISARITGRKGTRLYTVSLMSGRMTEIGPIGPNKRPVTLRALSVNG